MSPPQRRKAATAGTAAPRGRKRVARRLPKPAKTSPPPAAPLPEPGVPVVGIGASAGGLEALSALFGAMPARTGLAFVVVIHLEPTHESLMSELIGKRTGLLVEQARDAQPLEVDHVYIIPPNRTLVIDGGRLEVREVPDRRDLRGTIDRFFRSLARERRDEAIGVVLSGTGTEGTLGLRAIKAEGGLVVVQAPATAAQPGMPASAIATGLVDLVLPPDEIPDALLAYVETRRREQDGARKTEGLDSLHRILGVLRARTKHDFRGYKRGTLERRIVRRMGLHQIDDTNEYLDLLHRDATEADQLFKDLLIGVTSFFRDPEVFDELATRVLAPLIRDRDPGLPIRIWVPGCSTGEEAYSIAIVAAEQVARAQSSRHIQIFATDVDESALAVARSGTYPESVALDVTPERLRQFFTHARGRYRVIEPIRETIVFAVQNVIGDPPFSNLDLVSCRNVLIYLEPEVQRRVVGLFHFALNPDGCLLLGTAEKVGTFEHLFVPVTKRGHVFRRLGGARRSAAEFPTAFLRPAEVAPPAPRSLPEPTVAALADRELLAHCAPAAVVVRPGGQIVRLYGAMDRYLALTAGDATLDVVALAHDSLKPALRGALHDVLRRNRPTVVEAVDVPGHRDRGLLRISLRPIDVPGTAERLFLLVFESVAPRSRPPSRRPRGRSDDVVRQLEAELRTTRREQQRLVGQFEGSNEELKAANEEILSMNEELQSTNEELVTSKEELQSMNEELTTLNAQLQEKVQELTVVNDDLANLLAGTDIATVFIDADLRIKRFTAAATHLLNLLPSDIGRPIAHLATNLLDVDLSGDARAVLHNATPVETHVASKGGGQYLVRVLPYRTQDGRVQGVVLTLTDVTALKTIERDLRVTQDQLRQMNETLELRVTERTRWLALLHEVTRAINEARTWDEALDRVLRGICRTEDWQVGYVYLPDRHAPDGVVAAISYLEAERFRPFHLVSQHRHFARGQDLPGRVFADGKPAWVNNADELLSLVPDRRDAALQTGLRAGAALPVIVGAEVIAVLELFSDQPHQASETLTDLMHDLNAQIGRLLERERVTAQMADELWREQRDLVNTLHDSLGQVLTGLGLLSSALAQRLVDTDPETAEMARQIAGQAQLALEEVRQLSKGLFPVDVDAESLPQALRHLASATEAMHRIRVRVEGDTPLPVRDARTATQLYRIAQEAITNVIKHANATTIRIQVGVEDGVATLKIADDGVGIAATAPRGEGLGLRIMQYRARSIGARLSLAPDSRGGTVVTCTWREKPPAPAAG